MFIGILLCALSDSAAFSDVDSLVFVRLLLICPKTTRKKFPSNNEAMATTGSNAQCLFRVGLVAFRGCLHNPIDKLAAELINSSGITWCLLDLQMWVNGQMRAKASSAQKTFKVVKEASHGNQINASISIQVCVASTIFFAEFRNSSLCCPKLRMIFIIMTCSASHLRCWHQRAQSSCWWHLKLWNFEEKKFFPRRNMKCAGGWFDFVILGSSPRETLS